MIWLLVGCGDGDVVGDSPAGDPVEDVGDSTVEVVPGETARIETGETGSPVEVPVPDVTVDCAGGADFTTITEAMAASRSGTKIGLRPCTYAEDVDFAGKSLDVFGLEGSAATVIQGTGRGSVVTADHGESVGTRLSGVTITGGGRGDGYGSGVYAALAVLTLEDVVFTGNTGASAVLYAQGAFLELRDVTFTDNAVVREGAMIVADNGSLLGERVTVACEDEAYGVYQHVSMLLTDSLVECGDTAAIVVDRGELHLRRSTVRSASIAVYGEDKQEDDPTERLWLYNSVFVGGIAAVDARYMHLKADHDVFWADLHGLKVTGGHAESFVENSAAVADTCGIKGDGSLRIAWNAIQGDSGTCRANGTGTVTGDPMFVAAPDDFHLQASSPLRDVGDPDPEQDDLDGSRSDIGRFGGPAGSW